MKNKRINYTSTDGRTLEPMIELPKGGKANGKIELDLKEVFPDLAGNHVEKLVVYSNGRKTNYVVTWHPWIEGKCAYLKVI